MKIPNSVKVGGRTYTVIETTNLKNGVNGYSGEIDYLDLEIRLVPCARGRMESVFLHELTHAMYDHLGYSEHDEKKIDELSNALYMVIQDNPDIFRPVE